MATFIVALVLGVVFYGTLVERLFGIDTQAKTPALTKTDGVDQSDAGGVHAVDGNDIPSCENARTRGKDKFCFAVALVPALFMTMVSVSYIFIAPEGFRFYQMGISWVTYLIAAVVTIACQTGFSLWYRKQNTQPLMC